MVRPARSRSYLDFEKLKATAAAARRYLRGLTWLGRARRAGGTPVEHRGEQDSQKWKPTFDYLVSAFFKHFFFNFQDKLFLTRRFE